MMEGVSWEWTIGGEPAVCRSEAPNPASPHMTMRYMKHAPERYFQEDAAKVAASLSGERNGEAEAQAALAREGQRGLGRVCKAFQR
jgi:hypothetical protein